jgi:hypothetical protein
MGEGVPPCPWRERPLSHGERDRVRGGNASSSRCTNRPGGMPLGTTLGTGRRRRKQPCAGPRKRVVSRTLVPPATLYADAVSRVRGECRWNYIGQARLRVQLPPGSPVAGKVSSLLSPRLLLTASGTKRGLRVRQNRPGECRRDYICKMSVSAILRPLGRTTKEYRGECSAGVHPKPDSRIRNSSPRPGTNETTRMP